MNVLVLLAHHDDEFFVSARIRRELKSGNRVLVTYTTWGSAYGTPAEIREAESQRALAMMGVPARDIVMLGRELGIVDGSAGANCASILNRCREIYRTSRVERIITPAWEGGHPDHDITFLVAKRLATESGARDELYEFPLYTAAGAPSRLFRVNRFAGQGGETAHSALGQRERITSVLLARCYRSQWRSFVGLLPEAAARFVILGRQELRLVRAPSPGASEPPERPHRGPLFYQQRFGVSFEDLLSDAAPLLEHCA